MEKTNLFLLPFAGGSVYSYRGFAGYAPPHLNLIPVELPGRGTRMREPLLTDIYRMADDVYAQVAGRLHEPYAIYGHSMGSLLGYLLVKRLLAAGRPAPEHLFFTGCAGPSCEAYLGDKAKHNLPKAQFIQKLQELGGSPDEVLQTPALFDFFEPIIRADFRATDTYRYQETTPFDIPVTVAIGLQERATHAQALLWQRETTQPVEVRQFPGKHFFIFDYERQLVEIISNKLKHKVSYE